MRKISLFFLVALFFIAIFCLTDAIGQREIVTETNYVFVCCFHDYSRSPRSLSIERYARDAVGEYFRNDLDSKKIIFKTINVREKGYENYIDKYGLYNIKESFVISLIKNDKVVKYKSVTDLGKYSEEKHKFQEYVRNVITEYLK